MFSRSVARMFPGGDLNGGVVEVPGDMCVHGTMVHSSSTMVLGICHGCHEGCFLDDCCAIVLDSRAILLYIPNTFNVPYL